MDNKKKINSKNNSHLSNSNSTKNDLIKPKLIKRDIKISNNNNNNSKRPLTSQAQPYKSVNLNEKKSNLNNNNNIVINKKITSSTGKKINLIQNNINITNKNNNNNHNNINNNNNIKKSKKKFLNYDDALIYIQRNVIDNKLLNISFGKKYTSVSSDMQYNEK